MEDVRDSIFSRSVGAIGKLKRVQSNRDGGASQVKSSHLYLYSTLTIQIVSKQLNNIKIGK